MTTQRHSRHLATGLAGEFVGLQPKTLANMRSLGTGPAYIINAGGRITYDERDLIAWREKQVVQRVNPTQHETSTS